MLVRHQAVGVRAFCLVNGDLGSIILFGSILGWAGL